MHKHNGDDAPKFVPCNSYNNSDCIPILLSPIGLSNGSTACCSRASVIGSDYASCWTIRSSNPGGFFVLQKVQTISGNHSALYSIGTIGFFPGVMRSGHQVDHLPPFSAEVKNGWSCTFIPPLYFQGLHKGRFNFFTCVLYEVKTEYLYLMQIIFSFQGFIAE